LSWIARTRSPSKARIRSSLELLVAEVMTHSDDRPDP
jgi:hypothetical protein